MKNLSISSEELTQLLFSAFLAGKQRGIECDCFPEDNPAHIDQTVFEEWAEKNIKKS